MKNTVLRKRVKRLEMEMILCHLLTFISFLYASAAISQLHVSFWLKGFTFVLGLLYSFMAMLYLIDFFRKQSKKNR